MMKGGNGVSYDIAQGNSVGQVSTGQTPASQEPQAILPRPGHSSPGSTTGSFGFDRLKTPRINSPSASFRPHHRFWEQRPRLGLLQWLGQLETGRHPRCVH